MAPRKKKVGEAPKVEIPGGPPSPFNHLVPQYLIHSLLYYQLGDSVITDSEFDDLCHTILDHWDEINHPHKRFLTKEDMTAGTGFALPFAELPTVVKVVAYAFLERQSEYMEWLEQYRLQNLRNNSK